MTAMTHFVSSALLFLLAAAGAQPQYAPAFTYAAATSALDVTPYFVNHVPHVAAAPAFNHYFAAPAFYNPYFSAYHPRSFYSPNYGFVPVPSSPSFVRTPLLPVQGTAFGLPHAPLFSAVATESDDVEVTEADATPVAEAPKGTFALRKIFPLFSSDDLRTGSDVIHFARPEDAKAELAGEAEAGKGVIVPDFQ